MISILMLKLLRINKWDPTRHTVTIIPCLQKGLKVKTIVRVFLDTFSQKGQSDDAFVTSNFPLPLCFKNKALSLTHRLKSNQLYASIVQRTKTWHK